MTSPTRNLRDDALAIWQAGVDAVAPQRLIPKWLEASPTVLRIGDDQFDVDAIGRVAIVGAGKAGAGMALAVEEALGAALLKRLNVIGWVNVPADCLATTGCVHLHAARPAGVNEPRIEGVRGAEEILRIVASLGDRDVCLCLLSGGGSALLPAPAAGVTLEDKVEITRAIASRGGSIEQLNAVRRELSRIKGGGLARACRAGRLYTLILSDVLGDDLATIASGPTVLRVPTPAAALAVLHDLHLEDLPAGQRVIRLLNERNAHARPFTQSSPVPAQMTERVDGSPRPAPEALGEPSGIPGRRQVNNLVIGNNAVAVDAAGVEAERRGYRHAMVSANAAEGRVEDVAAHLVQMARSMRGGDGPDCLISGGEPTVELAPAAERGLGGRNQQLCLEALTRVDNWRGLAMLSGGTDGEDGPTDAAGAVVDQRVFRDAQKQHLDPRDFLRRNDAYHFFEPIGGLVKTGPTHTNVCDVRVITVDRSAQ